MLTILAAKWDYHRQKAIKTELTLLIILLHNYTYVAFHGAFIQPGKIYSGVCHIVLNNALLALHLVYPVRLWLIIRFSSLLTHSSRALSPNCIEVPIQHLNVVIDLQSRDIQRQSKSLLHALNDRSQHGLKAAWPQSHKQAAWHFKSKSLHFQRPITFKTKNTSGDLDGLRATGLVLTEVEIFVSQIVFLRGEVVGINSADCWHHVVNISWGI